MDERKVSGAGKTGQAGAEAERQMAFYLHRGLAAEPELFVLNDLRLVDPQQPEHDGRPGVCQIDHLVLHRWGAFIIESKSVVDEVIVRDDGAGGDEWARRFRGREQGFPSPLQQAGRQAEFLRAFLQRHRETLLGEMPTGLRTLSKLVAGTAQRGFKRMPIQLIVAISDRGKIRRVNRWKEPAKPFLSFVSKADLVTAKILEEVGKHRSAAGPFGKADNAYGIWAMKVEEAGAVAEFLRSHHQPRSAPERREPAPATPAAGNPDPHNPEPPGTQLPPGKPASGVTAAGASCKACGGTDLAAKWGKYGYYWKCNACDTNTPMPTVCSACGAEGKRGRLVKIKKEGPKYFRVCESCGISERVWVEG